MCGQGRGLSSRADYRREWEQEGMTLRATAGAEEAEWQRRRIRVGVGGYGAEAGHTDGAK